MNLGKDIEFILKKAEELKSEEKSVSAPAPKPTESDVKSDDKINVTVPELPPPTKAESEDKPAIKDEEKSAADTSARDKAMELATKAGRPTSTGIAAGAGAGAIMAALGALHRLNSDNGETSILSNPALLGLLGAAGGYAGGNLLDGIGKPDAPSSKKEKANLAIPGAVTALGTLGLGGGLAKMDQEARDAFIEKEFPRLARLMPKGKNGTISMSKATPAQAEKFLKAKNEFKRLKERRGFAENIEELGLGKPHSESQIRWDKINRSAFNPINQIKALNPFKKLPGSSKSGLKLLRSQLASLLKGTKGKPMSSVPGRLAAIAALAGAGTLGVNAVRNAINKD